MLLKAPHNRVHDVLRESIIMMCQSGIPFNTSLKITGQLAIEVDGTNVVLINIQEALPAMTTGNLGGSHSTLSRKKRKLNSKPSKDKNQASEETQNDRELNDSTDMTPGDSKSEAEINDENSSDRYKNSEMEIKEEVMDDDSKFDTQSEVTSDFTAEGEEMKDSVNDESNSAGVNFSSYSTSTPKTNFPPLFMAPKIGDAGDSTSTDGLNPTEIARQVARRMLALGQLPDTSFLESQKLPKVRKPGNELTFAEKIKVIEARQQGYSQRKIASMFDVGRTQVHLILRRQEEYLQYLEQNVDMTRKRTTKKKTNNDEINAMVWQWYNEETAVKGPISGPRIQEKALQFAQVLGFTEFKASNGWLDCFKRRHGLPSALVRKAKAAEGSQNSTSTDNNKNIDNTGLETKDPEKECTKNDTMNSDSNMFPKAATSTNQFEDDSKFGEPPKLSSEPHNLSSEPHNLSTEPQNLKTEAHNLSNEPHNLTSESHNVSSEPPKLSNETPRLASESPKLSNETPRFLAPDNYPQQSMYNIPPLSNQPSFYSSHQHNLPPGGFSYQTPSFSFPQHHRDQPVYNFPPMYYDSSIDGQMNNRK